MGIPPPDQISETKAGDYINRFFYVLEAPKIMLIKRLLLMT